MDDFAVLDRIDNAHKATLTHPDGRPLTWLGQFAAAIWLTADFLVERSDWDLSATQRGCQPEEYTREQHARILAIISSI